MPRFAHILLTLTGLVLIGTSSFIIWKRNDPKRLQFDTFYVAQTEIAQSGNTVSGVEIREIGLSLPVIPANKTGNNWDTTPDGVSYLVSTPMPGEKGNSVMYGHNWASILGNLHQVRVGNTIEVYYSNQDSKEFKVVSVNEVAPSDSSMLLETENSTLTIYTCSGIFDQKRLVVTSVLL